MTLIFDECVYFHCCRMGSFTSAVKIQNDDTQDNDLAFPDQISRQELLQHCQKQLAHLPAPIKRSFRRANDTDEDMGLKYMKLNSISKGNIKTNMLKLINSFSIVLINFD